MYIIETERLHLRELTIEDQKDLAKVLSDPVAMQHYNGPFSQEKVRDWILWNRDSYIKNHHGLWAVILKDSNEFIGDCGITMQEIDQELVPEIGFHIIRDYWNKGYATEAAQACKEYAFEVLEYPEIYSYTTLSNIPSQKVAEKIGMRTYKVFEKNDVKQIAQKATNNEMR
ncbi:GNAT family N-acetyltransferase [Piscibacillus sp. B03]|uniref:GNAT family N-acetyltransferase n=1 Tax=Piscibacillus sp. B03 TaxID=3457430 RepID=UPI003FCCF997